MRYCPQSDGYFLHWDNKVGQHLARIKGLENGVYNMFGVQRYINEEGNQVRESLVAVSYQKSIVRPLSLDMLMILFESWLSSICLCLNIFCLVGLIETR